MPDSHAQNERQPASILTWPVELKDDRGPIEISASEASCTKWELVDANSDLIDSIVYKAVGDKRIAREDAEEALANAKLLAGQLANRHVGTDEEYKHYLSYVLKRRLKWDKTRATDAMDWQDWYGLPKDESPTTDESPRMRIKAPRPARADAAVSLPEDLIRTLPPRQRVIARLVVEGKNIHQIARRLGRKPSQLAHLRGEMTKIKNAITGE
jgi:DNA-binding CsgD family transcriptional regulator